MYVSKDLKNDKIHSETSLGSTMDMHFRVKDETNDDAIKIEFKKLESLRPSLFSKNFEFLDDYTV